MSSFAAIAALSSFASWSPSANAPLSVEAGGPGDRNWRPARSCRVIQCAMDWTSADQLGRMVSAIVETVHPDRIILFGSRARGDSHASSDFDLLVVMPLAGSRREARLRIGLALAPCRTPVDVLLATPDELERYGKIPGSLVYPAVKDGKVLYERS